MSKIYLIPTPLSNYKYKDSRTLEIAPELDLLIAESHKGAESFMKNYSILDVDSVLLNEHSKENDFIEIANAIIDNDLIVGLISDAGSPAVADPGARLVALLHEAGEISVIPLPGPTSIIMSLMASGLNGQQFAFHGYLAKDKNNIEKELLNFANDIQKTNTTHIFIETPYRNQKLFEIILSTYNGKYSDIKLSISMNLTSDEEYILTKRIFEYKTPQEFNTAFDLLKKSPAVFLLGN